MAAQNAQRTDDRRDTTRRNWFHLTKGWKRHEAWRTLTPSYRIIFFSIIDIANELWFPDSIVLYEADLANESATSTRSVKRALEELRDAGVLHFGTVEEDEDRRRAVRILIDYDALTRLGRRQFAGSGATKSAVCRHLPKKTQSECGSTLTQVQLQKEQPNCPNGQLRVPEVGGGMREGDLCPKCQTYRLSVRFKTNAGSRTKQRFLACRGFQSGGCRGFTWQLSSSPYEPSERVLSQALTGARHVPGRPGLVQDVIAGTHGVDEPTPMTDDAPLTLAEWFSKAGYLPLELMLDSLGDMAPDMASRHRAEGSDKSAILRAVKARIAEDSG